MGNAMLDQRFAEDEMIRKYNIQSVACIPILSQDKLRAMLYLENNQMTDVFTLERMEILKHLSSQFGVSVENALLYESLNEKVEELRESQERYDLALAGSSSGVWDWDITYDKVYYSDRFKELLGYTPDESWETPEEFWSKMHPDDDKDIRLALEKHLKERVPYLVDCRLQTKSGKYRWFHSRGQALWDEKGNATRMSGSLVDITMRKEAEEELIKQREALARVGRTNRLGQLTGSIAHELNQPLAGILSNAQAIELQIKKGQVEKEELEEIMADIVSDTKRAGEVIRNLRDLYREQKVDFIPIDLNVVIKETLLLLHSEFVIQHVELTTAYTPSLPRVNGNKVQIQQVLVNLILNSNQAMRDVAKKKRRLHLASTSDGNEVRVCVEDSGKGIKTEIIDKIFEPLATWNQGGTGMGLAISQSIIESLGGKMWAENRQEGGARVGFVIPAMKGGGQV